MKILLVAVFVALLAVVWSRSVSVLEGEEQALEKRILCPLALCDLYCPNGFLYSSTGCRLCACRSDLDIII